MWALKLPLTRSEALLLRRVLDAAGTLLRGDAAHSRGLTREAQLFAADEIGNIRERLKALLLKGTNDA